MGGKLTQGDPNVTKLIVFNIVSLDGFIADPKGDMSWAHRQDPEWRAFTSENAKREATFLFGRLTYEMMAGFWPTPFAIENLPDVAMRMNGQRKVVFSRTLEKAPWNNTALVKGDPAAHVRRMKEMPGPDMVILGSGTIVSQLAQEGLVDEFQIAVNPTVLGGGRSMFAGVRDRLSLRLARTRVFANGNVLLCYEPVA